MSDCQGYCFAAAVVLFCKMGVGAPAGVPAFVNRLAVIPLSGSFREFGHWRPLRAGASLGFSSLLPY
jgi:hypothetical protein